MVTKGNIYFLHQNSFFLFHVISALNSVNLGPKTDEDYALAGQRNVSMLE